MSHPHIDASEAIAKLGITHPVKFEFKNMNGGLPPFLAEALLGGTIQGGVDDLHPSVIRLDLDAIEYQKSLGTEANYSDLAHIVAHELVHVRQIQDAGSPEAANRAYNLAGGSGAGYHDNQFEQKAFKLAPSLAPLVKVTL